MASSSSYITMRADARVVIAHEATTSSTGAPIVMAIRVPARLDADAIVKEWCARARKPGRQVEWGTSLARALDLHYYVATTYPRDADDPLRAESLTALHDAPLTASRDVHNGVNFVRNGVRTIGSDAQQKTTTTTSSKTTTEAASSVRPARPYTRAHVASLVRRSLLSSVLEDVGAEVVRT